jgi:hypothetical protein
MIAPAATPPTTAAPEFMLEFGATTPARAAAVPPTIAPVPAPLAVFDGGAPELAQPAAKRATAVPQLTSGVREKRGRGKEGLMVKISGTSAPGQDTARDWLLFQLTPIFDDAMLATFKWRGLGNTPVTAPTFPLSSSRD